MRDVLLLVWLLSGVARGTQPKGGYCIGNSCIAVFDLTLDFSGAQDICQQHKGNLMTVRSSVAHDTLSLLLGNSSGQHWIGLHLPEGCPDTTSNLRGFQWITEDTTSDFFNWAEDPTVGKYEGFLQIFPPELPGRVANLQPVCVKRRAATSDTSPR
uniref:C-type lectin domain-containing protein n=1 Tax=Knipowitschia caucasica TaxID=637954 RepID=A0AAV2K8X8_KNICA